MAKDEKTKAIEAVIEDADQEKLNKSNAIVKKYMWWSMGAGLIPIPIVDAATVSGVQLKMLSDLSKVYECRFSKSIGKSIVGALLGGLSADALTRSYFTGLIKSIPIIGIVGAVSMPLYSGAATWAIGKVFIQHFASGGTFLDFQPKEVKDYFKRLFSQGQEIARDMKSVKA